MSLRCWSCASNGRSYLTIHPADTYGLKYGDKQQAHPAGSVRVKQLKDVHPPLIGRDRCQLSATAGTRTNDALNHIWSESGKLDLACWSHWPVYDSSQARTCFCTLLKITHWVLSYYCKTYNHNFEVHIPWVTSTNTITFFYIIVVCRATKHA